MPKKRTALYVITSNILGILFFLLGIYILNILTGYIQNDIFYQVVIFLNNNILLILIMSLFFFIADLFEAFIFPINLPAPIFNAIASVFLLSFIGKLFFLIDQIANINIYPIFSPFLIIFYPIIFLIVLIVGYVNIFADLLRSEKSKKKPKKVKPKKKPSKKQKSWEDVGEEFKMLLSDTIQKLREKVNKK